MEAGGLVLPLGLGRIDLGPARLGGGDDVGPAFSAHLPLGLGGRCGLGRLTSLRLGPARLGTGGHPCLGLGAVFPPELRRCRGGTAGRGLLTFEFRPACLLCRCHLRLGGRAEVPLAGSRGHHRRRSTGCAQRLGHLRQPGFEVGLLLLKRGAEGDELFDVVSFHRAMMPAG